MDYVNVATTVFTPLEYSACGYSEEAALEKFGEHSIEVYHRKFWPLEWTIAGHDPQLCYMKCITLRDQPNGEEPVIGIGIDIYHATLSFDWNMLSEKKLMFFQCS